MAVDSFSCGWVISAVIKMALLKANESAMPPKKESVQRFPLSFGVKSS
jgi:hypothetical protein